MPMRTDQAWVCALDAVHHCVFRLNEVNQYDFFFDDFIGNVLLAWTEAGKGNK